MLYHVDYSQNIYKIMQDGIENAMLLPHKMATKIFKEISKDGVAALFEIKTEGSGTYVAPENIRLIDPYELGIANKLSHNIYTLYKANNTYIIDKINKVASLLVDSGNKDLADYLSIALNVSLNKKAINTKLTYNNIVNKLGKDSAGKKKLFESLYKTAYSKCVEAKVDNPQNVAIMVVARDMGIDAT